MADTHLFQNLVSNIGKVIVGKDKQIEDVICCWMAGGHVLIEDVPGTGKTILARALAKSVYVPFNRVQFTPDLLPSDIVGTSIYRQKEQKFEFMPGPLFTTILLADEINRATPRTQSALLEAMSEGQVSSDGQTFPLDPLFLTIATQNPVEQLGTFTLPEAQLDRFMIKISMGYPTADKEVEMLKAQHLNHPIQDLSAVANHEQLLSLQKQVRNVQVASELYDYIIRIMTSTRQHPDLRLGASPRAALALTRATQASALFKGQSYITPSDVQALLKPVLAHRLILKPESRIAGRTSEEIIEQIRKSVPVPTRRAA